MTFEAQQGSKLQVFVSTQQHRHGRASRAVPELIKTYTSPGSGKDQKQVVQTRFDKRGSKQKK